ncbi:hypothetical protein [Devosia faecipullorum]|uniref:hypothetical protein n=1 Tax=Devosia faecipullorum TaxID=2755039 RepID=UPI00187B9F8A|nr:hypothetical protein [Devosia faecipullorum]MBE7733303.1 hypothetical protein [Devosia faecipullorum]
MKSIAPALLLAALASAPALAALPPHYQRQAEFVAALGAAVEVLGISSPVDSIILSEPDRFEVKAGNCTLIVTIVDAEDKGAAGMVGPRQFRAEAGEKHCQ